MKCEIREKYFSSFHNSYFPIHNSKAPAVIDANQMRARVFVKPTKTAEFIELNFILTSSGADFSEVL